MRPEIATNHSGHPCFMWVSKGGGGKVRGAMCKVVKCEVPVRGINARRWVICEAGMCEAQRTTGAAGVVVGCEPLKRN